MQIQHQNKWKAFIIPMILISTMFEVLGFATVYSVFYKEMVEKHNMSSKACLLARSRSGLMLYNWASDNSGPVACFAGIYPVCNLKSYSGIAKACQSYGLPESELTAQLAQHLLSIVSFCWQGRRSKFFTFMVIRM
jgi:hypothetical protein